MPGADTGFYQGEGGEDLQWLIQDLHVEDDLRFRSQRAKATLAEAAPC